MCSGESGVALHSVGADIWRAGVVTRDDIDTVSTSLGVDPMTSNDPLRARLRAAEAALDHVSCAVFILDPNGVVRLANAGARRLAAEGDGLVLAGRRLTATVNGDAGRLRDLIATVATARIGRVVRPAVRAMAVRRGTGRAALCVALMPAPVEPAARSCDVLLYAVDPSAHRRAPISQLREALGLTDREIDVALATVRLGSVPAAAGELGIALTTARSHLQHVFDKTGARHQAALAQMFAVLGALPVTDGAVESPT